MNQTYFFNLIFLFLVTPFVNAGELQQDSLHKSADVIFETAKKIRHENPDSSMVLLQEAYEEFMRSGDTLQGIEVLLEMPHQYGQRVNYAKSYDGLWLSLLLADDLKNDALKAQIYSRLGRLYSFFKRKEEAFKYLETSLQINKDLVSKGQLNSTYLTQNYYLICSTYRELGEPEMGKVYLDSSFMRYANVPDQLALEYLQFEKAFILAKENQSAEALSILQEIEPWFLENRPSYLVLVYTYWGDIFNDISDLQKSETYYKRALEISDRYNSHVDFSPLVHERLAELYVRRGDYEAAYTSLNLAKELDALLFDSRSEINRPLLEIKDEFRRSKEEQERLIQEQRLEQLEQEDKISFLQRIILLGTIFFLLILGWIYLRNIRSKHKAEKQLLQRSKELEIQKAKEVLELKNKELAASALQLVEKDEFLREIKSRLRSESGGLKTSEINQVLKSISVSNSNNWEEFKLRFTAVNEKFYRKVTNEYPNLSQSDQKICALIKLNFSSKEMARLLGISVESVHTTRYRLRKKMGLERSVNLEDFISAL